MIQVTPHMRILVAVEPIDFRAGIDAVAGLCRRQLAADPFSGALFIFTNRRRSAIKILVYDGNGFWLCQKRLSSGCFAFWPTAATPVLTLEAHQLHVLLMGGDPARADAPPPWRRLPLSG